MDNFKFDAATQKELEGFLAREQAQSRLHGSIHKFTELCWDRCITSTPSASFSRAEQSCLNNCVERFLDTSLFMVKQIEQKRGNIS